MNTRTKGLVPAVRPTIVAAVGGTGVAAAKYTIASMTDLLGSRPGWLAVRAFDTDVQDNRLPRLMNKIEFVQLSNFNVRAVLDAANEKPEFRYLKDWLPPLLSAQQISTGVGGVRPKGRLCYCHKRDGIKTAIQSAMGAVRRTSDAREINDTGGLIVDVASGIDVHIISSVCGGTGSSMFLDLAYDVRNWAQSITTGDVTVTGHLVLPGAFAHKPVLTPVLEANAYAALQELDRFMRGDKNDPWRMQYGPSDTVESSAPPFDYCYLLDGIGRGGVTDVDEIVSIIGDTIAQMTVGAVGARLKSQIRNTTDTILSRTDSKDRPCCYSSYNLVMLEVKNDLIVRRVTAPIARAVADRLTAPPTSLEDIDERLKATTSTFGISGKDLVQSIEPAQLPRDQILMIGDEFPDRARIDLNEESQKLRSTHHDRELARLAADLLVADKVQVAIRKQLVDMLPSNGGRYCVNYLGSIVEEVRKRLDEIREASRQHRASVTRPKPPEIGTRFQDREVTDAEDAIRDEVISALLNRRSQDLDNLRASMEQLRDSWGGFCSGFNYSATEELASDSMQKARGGRISTVDAEYFEGRRRDVQPQVVANVLGELAPEIANWHVTTMPGIAEQIRVLSAKYWGDMAGDQHDCEDTFLRGCKGDPGIRLAQYLSSALPMWEIDEGYPLADKVHEISAIGTTNASPLFQRLHQSEGRLQACDDQRQDLIPIIRTQHGLSLIGLKRLAIYRKPFIQAAIDEQRWDFHLFNDRRWISSMEFPDEPESYLEDYRVFCLAYILEMFIIHASRGYEFAPNVISGDLQPVPGPFRTRREVFVFLQQQGQFAQLRQKVDKKIQEEYGADSFSISGVSTGSDMATGDPGAADDGAEKYVDRLRIRINQYINILRSRIENALKKFETGDRSRSEGVLKADVAQIHTELRAMQSLLKERQLGL